MGRFDYGWLGIDPAKGVSELLTNALVENASYIVLERSKSEQIIDERNLGASGRVDASTEQRKLVKREWRKKHSTERSHRSLLPKRNYAVGVIPQLSFAPKCRL